MGVSFGFSMGGQRHVDNTAAWVSAGSLVICVGIWAAAKFFSSKAEAEAYAAAHGGAEALQEMRVPALVAEMVKAAEKCEKTTIACLKRETAKDAKSAAIRKAQNERRLALRLYTSVYDRASGLVADDTRFDSYAPSLVEDAAKVTFDDARSLAAAEKSDSAAA